MTLFVTGCPHADVFPENVPEEDEDPVHGVTSGVAVTARIACDAATVLPQDRVQELFHDSCDRGGRIGCLGATLTPEKKMPKHGKGTRNHVGKDVLFEFACAKGSSLGEVGHTSGVRVIRLCKEDINLEDPHSIEQLIAQVGALKGCSIHGCIECRPWIQWQHLSRTKYPKLAARINQEQAESAALVKQFIRVYCTMTFALTMVEIAVSNGRVIALVGHYHRFNRGFLNGTCVPRLSMDVPSELKPTASQQRNVGGSSRLHCARPRILQPSSVLIVVMHHFEVNGLGCQHFAQNHCAI